MVKQSLGGRYFSGGGGKGGDVDNNKKKASVPVENLAASENVTVFEPRLDKGNQNARKRVSNSLKKKNSTWINKDQHGQNRKTFVKKRNFNKPPQNTDEDDDAETKQKKEDERKPVPVPEEKLHKYYRDEPVDIAGVKSRLGKSQVQSKEATYEHALRFTAKSEMMLMEDHGYIQTEAHEDTAFLTQHQILKDVDLITKQKYFDLKLDKFGPYRVSYTRNGRYLAMVGARGHIACFDWLPKRLMCEVDVKERCRDVAWLHQETMYAVAQRRLCIYDNQGIELHCIKQMENIERLEFLPYHFLLAAGHASGFLSYLDVSIGKMVASFHTHELGPLNVMCQNPSNAIIHLGHRGGTVTLWSPNVRESLMKILCHRTPIQSVAVDNSGNYMATSALDRRINIWDLRQQSQKLATLVLPCGASSLSFSQRGLLAASFGNAVQVYDAQSFINKSDDTEAEESSSSSPLGYAKRYLRHTVTSQIENVRFCPFEDVMAIGYESGVSSIIVPGSGEPNFDAVEVNPFISRKQRREAEVKQLLDKIQPELIDLDPSRILEVHRPSLHDREEQKRKLLLRKPEDLTIEPRNRVRGLPIEKRKRIIKSELLMKRKQELIGQKQLLDDELKNDKSNKRNNTPKKTGIDGVLSRFSKPQKT